MKKNILILIILFHFFSIQADPHNQHLPISLGVAGVSIAGATWAWWQSKQIAKKLPSQRHELGQIQEPAKDPFYAKHALLVSQRNRLAAAKACAALNDTILTTHSEVQHSQQTQTQNLTQLRAYEEDFPEIKPHLAAYAQHYSGEHRCEVETNRDTKNKKNEICHGMWKPHNGLKETLTAEITKLDSEVNAKKYLDTHKPLYDWQRIKDMRKHRRKKQKKEAGIKSNENKSWYLKVVSAGLSLFGVSTLCYYFYPKK